jgi:hypothetical protein
MGILSAEGSVSCIRFGLDGIEVLTEEVPELMFRCAVLTSVRSTHPRNVADHTSAEGFSPP